MNDWLNEIIEKNRRGMEATIQNANKKLNDFMSNLPVAPGVHFQVELWDINPLGKHVCEVRTFTLLNVAKSCYDFMRDHYDENYGEFGYSSRPAHMEDPDFEDAENELFNQIRLVKYQDGCCAEILEAYPDPLR